jgi:tetratricopeptide (TPR) repeat protein
VKIFRSRPQPVTSSDFVGNDGHDELAALVDTFLRSCGANNEERALAIAQRIFAATPIDNPQTRGIPSDFFDRRPWKWILAVAERAEESGDRSLAAKIGLMAQIWNRIILKEEPRYQMGRLMKAPLDLEQQVYTAALRSLVRMASRDILIPGGDDGWSVGDALNQIADCVQLLPDEGITVNDELRHLALADPAAVAALRGPPSGDEPTGARTRDTLKKIHQAIREAEDGDPASDAYLRGGAIVVNGGDALEALNHFEQAARLGHTDGMYEAGGTASKLGDTRTAHYWWEAAANAGHAGAAWNLAAGRFRAGDLPTARKWYLRTAELGDSRGYGALTQMAKNADNRAEELKWSQAGAEAGELFCMLSYGTLVAMEDSSTDADLRRVLPHLERAGELGDSEGMFIAGLVHGMLGNRYEERKWLLRAEAAGHPKASQTLRQCGD